MNEDTCLVEEIEFRFKKPLRSVQLVRPGIDTFGFFQKMRLDIVGLNDHRHPATGLNFAEQELREA